MRVDNLTMEQVTENILKIGLEHRHPYLAMYLNGSYQNIDYDEHTRTWRLHVAQNKLQKITDIEMEKWQKPLGYRRKKRVVSS